MNDFLEKSIVLISGATGMIGSQVIKSILKRSKGENNKITILALYRNEEKKNRVFRDYLDNPAIVWICQDICTPIIYSGRLDYIIHTAGVTGGSKQHIDYPMRTITTALNGTINLLELAREKGCKGFVYLSSLEIYGKTDFEAASIKETDGGYIDTMAVRSSYSESKRMCETICAAYAKQYGVPAKVARLTATYGEGAYYRDKRVLCEFARDIIECKDIVLKSLGDTVRNYCDVSDAINAILIILERGIPGEAYNVANMDTEISIKELAERFVALFPETNISLRYDLSDDVSKLGYNSMVKIRLNTQKLEKLGWKPLVGIDEMIQNLVSAMKSEEQSDM